MAYTQLSRERGADNGVYDHKVPVKVRMSDFPLNRRSDYTIDPGYYVPVDLLETLPGDVWDINIRYLLKSLPLAVAPFTTYRVRTHWFYSPFTSLWKGAQTMTTKGMSGSLNLSFPTLDVYKTCKTEDESITLSFNVPQGLPSYFGFRPNLIGTYSLTGAKFFPFTEITGSSYSNVSIPNTPSSFIANALPFFMYQKVWRFDQAVPNLLNSNKVWYPDDISDGWRISYNGSNLVKGMFKPDSAPIAGDGLTSNGDSLWTTSDSPLNHKAVNLLQLRYCNFEQDRFTTALPWSTRGTAPVVDVTGTAQFTGGIVTIPVDTDSHPIRVEAIGYNGSSFGTFNVDDNHVLSVPGATSGSGVGTLQGYIHDNLIGSVTGGTGTVSNIHFGIDELRAKLALDVWQQRNARTQGHYNEMIYAHFGINPGQNDYEPIYIGGTSDFISFGDVIQTAPSASAPLGTQGGLAQTDSSGQVCKGFYTKDYGYIMGIMFIQPDTVYTQGVEKLWKRSTQEDIYFPEDEGLGLEPVLNYELYADGSSNDSQLFGWQERNTEYKARQNRALGFFSVDPSVDAMFSAYSQSRIFYSAPNLSQQFTLCTQHSMRRDFLAVPSYPAFRVSFASQIRVRRKMSYQNVPNTFGF